MSTKLNSHGVVIISTELKLTPVGETVVCNFSGRTVERSGQGESQKSVAHFFNFEIWDTAAKYLVENAKKGDRLILHSATPREQTWEKEEKRYSKVVFRVNDFTIFPYVPKEQPLD